VQHLSEKYVIRRTATVTFGRWQRTGAARSMQITAPAEGHLGMDTWTRSGP